jgi:hypothetical protein
MQNNVAMSWNALLLFHVSVVRIDLTVFGSRILVSLKSPRFNILPNGKEYHDSGAISDWSMTNPGKSAVK